MPTIADEGFPGRPGAGTAAPGRRLVRAAIAARHDVQAALTAPLVLPAARGLPHPKHAVLDVRLPPPRDAPTPCLVTPPSSGSTRVWTEGSHSISRPMDTEERPTCPGEDCGGFDLDHCAVDLRKPGIHGDLPQRAPRDQLRVESRAVAGGLRQVNAGMTLLVPLEGRSSRSGPLCTSSGSRRPSRGRRGGCRGRRRRRGPGSCRRRYPSSSAASPPW